MDTVLLITLVLLLGATLATLYLNLKSKTKDESENKEAEEIVKLNEEIVKAVYANVMTIPPTVKYKDRFLRAYQEAREKKIGLWNEN